MPKYEPRSLGTKDEDLLNRIRDRRTQGETAWDRTREAARLDIRCLTSEYGPWPIEEIKERRERITLPTGEQRPKRPCEHFDILEQFINRSMGRLRTQKRGIQVTPDGTGADEETAELRENRIRAIEYDSKAWQARWWAAACQRRQGYGAWRLEIGYESPRSNRRTLRVVPIPNPDSVLVDPFTKQPDRSDMRWAFEFERFSEEEFKLRWKKAEKRSFTPEDRNRAPSWIAANEIWVANYWEVELEEKTLFSIRAMDGQLVEILEDDLETASVPLDGYVEDERETEIPVVTQYVTNGLEILEETQWPGSTIPVLFLPGRETFDEDGQLVLQSLVRKAISSQLGYDFAGTTQIETVGLTGKPKYVGYTGQFEDGDSGWTNALREPVAYLEAKPTVDGTEHGEALPLPRFDAYEPPIQALEILKESMLRSAQNSMGISSTERKDRIAKSGEALKQLDAQADVGSHEFDDNLDMLIEYEGRMINEVLEIIEDSERDVALRKKDDTTETFRLQPREDQPHPYGPGQAHRVTISVGPTMESQQREAEDFVERLATSPQGGIAMDQLIRFKRLGNPGEVLEKRYKAMLPPPIQAMEQGELPPEAVGPILAAQQEAQAAKEFAQQLHGQLQQVTFQLKNKQAEIAGRLQQARENNASKEKVAALELQLDALEHLTDASIEREKIELEREKAALQAIEDADRLTSEERREFDRLQRELRR